MSENLPPWLTAKVDQRMAMVEEAMGLVGAEARPNLIVTPLTEPPEGAPADVYEKWERTCDKCMSYCPTPGWNFYTGHVSRTTRSGIQVAIAFGVCQTCKNRMHHP